jgi:hypothetical protein
LALLAINRGRRSEMRAYLFIFLFGAISIHAEAAETVYYVGESITTDAGGTVTRSPYIVARTTDQAAATITELVVSKVGGAFNENTSTMKISGNKLTMTESSGKISGQGTLTGKAWGWTFLCAEFKLQTPAYSMRIVDYNFFAEPGSILGHKDFFVTMNNTPGERLLQQEDVVLHPVDQAVFAAKRTELLSH